MDLLAAPKPVLTDCFPADLKVAHQVVVTAATPESVHVDDPLLGAHELRRAEFERRWLRDLICLP